MFSFNYLLLLVLFGFSLDFFSSPHLIGSVYPYIVLKRSYGCVDVLGETITSIQLMITFFSSPVKPVWERTHINSIILGIAVIMLWIPWKISFEGFSGPRTKRALGKRILLLNWNRPTVVILTL